MIITIHGARHGSTEPAAGLAMLDTTREPSGPVVGRGLSSSYGRFRPSTVVVG